MGHRLHNKPRPTRLWSVGVYTAILLGVCALDQLVKAWARTSLAASGAHDLIPGFLALNLVENRGAAFGLFAGHALPLAVFAAAVVLACTLYVLAGRHHTRLEIASLGLVCAGAVGNVIDRIALGYVTDMIQATFIDFPVFNIADIAITCGFVLFVIAVFLNPADEAPGDSKPEQEGVS